MKQVLLRKLIVIFPDFHLNLGTSIQCYTVLKQYIFFDLRYGQSFLPTWKMQHHFLNLKENLENGSLLPVPAGYVNYILQAM